MKISGIPMWELEEVPIYYVLRIIQYENIERAVEKAKAEAAQKGEG